jgi:hypoxanthine phosphoribosyltransferase
MNKIHYTQEQIDKLILKLARKIPKNKYKHVVGIANGGLNISQPLANLLGVPHSSIHISHYLGHLKRIRPVVDGEIPNAEGVLVVDDMVDFGATLKTLYRHFGVYDTAVLWCNPLSKIRPTYYVASKPEEYIVMPWEIDE